MNVNKELQKASGSLQKNNLNEALATYEKILSKYPMQPVALKNQAVICLNQKKLAQAELALEKLCDIEFDLNVIQNLIILKYDLEKIVDSKKYIDILIKYDKNNYIGQLYKAKIARIEKQYDIGIKVYENLLKDRPNDELTLLNYGFLLNESGQYSKAIVVYEQAETINEHNPAVLYNKGVTLMNLTDDINAERYFKKSIEIAPLNIDPYINLSSIYFRRSDINASKEMIMKALKLKPNEPKSIFQLAVNLNYEGDYQKSEDLYKQALKHDDNYIKAHYNLSINLLIQKKFNEFKEHYKWRVRDFELIKSANFVYDDFEIESINKDDQLLFYYEQGIGDQIFFSRFLKKLNNKMVLVSSHKTKRFFKKNLEKIEVIGKDEYEKDYKHRGDIKKINLASVIRFLNKVDIEKTRSIVFKPDQKDNTLIQKKYERLKVGISWKSREDNFGRSKGYPLFKLIESLNNKNNIELINLQYGSVEDELKKIDKEYGWKIKNSGDIDITNDMNDLAELISTCDIVVTCSNVTAHVAGVLGKKTLLILPKYYGRLWFWDYDEKKYSYWYPSVKIIINELNKWEDVFEMVYSALNSIEYEN